MNTTDKNIFDLWLNQKAKASELLGTHIDNLSFYAWPQVFGSSCGPFNGIGGQIVTEFNMVAFFDGKNAVLFCGDRMWKVIENFNPKIAVMGGY